MPWTHMHFFRPRLGFAISSARRVVRSNCPQAPSGRLLTTFTVLLGITTSLSSKRFFFRIVLPHARLQFGYPDMSYMPICLLSNAYFVYNAYCGPTLRCLACLTTCIRLGVGRLQSWIEHQHPLYQCGHLHWSKTE